MRYIKPQGFDATTDMRMRPTTTRDLKAIEHFIDARRCHHRCGQELIGVFGRARTPEMPGVEAEIGYFPLQPGPAATRVLQSEQ
ncbi:hypothetical protein [Nonomuraea maheshkhaliensis]|uniref:hypothetical protein n=1 Tax=Nonomuraea maheshkhaliensis TaxID=419590 RepID=UPI0031F8609C